MIPHPIKISRSPNKMTNPIKKLVTEVNNGMNLIVNQYIYLSKTKSETLDNIHSLFKQNRKSCKRRKETPENGEKQQ